MILRFGSRETFHFKSGKSQFIYRETYYWWKGKSEFEMIKELDTAGMKIEMNKLLGELMLTEMLLNYSLTISVLFAQFERMERKRGQKIISEMW